MKSTNPAIYPKIEKAATYLNNTQSTMVVENTVLDRIDHSKGYVPDNIQWIDVNVARAKTAFCDNGKRSEEEFIQMCNDVAITHPRSHSNTKSLNIPKNKMLR